jgi:hypothetical protein
MCNLVFLSLEIIFTVIFLHFYHKSPRCLFPLILARNLLFRSHEGIPNISSIPRIGKRLSSDPRIELSMGNHENCNQSSQISFCGKADGCDAKHSLPSGVGVKIACSYTPTPYIASLQTQGQIYFIFFQYCVIQ